MFFIPKGTVIKEPDELKEFIINKKIVEQGRFDIMGSLFDHPAAHNAVYVTVSGLIGYSSINSKEWTVKFQKVPEGWEVTGVRKTEG